MKKQPQFIKPPLRFLRSTHLERDFYDPEALNSYVLTDVATDCLRRIANGLKQGSGQRCWRIMGDYGSGKSSFALLLAHWFSGNAEKIPQELSSRLAYTTFGVSAPRLLPVLVTGAREALGETIRRGISSALEHHYPSGLGKGPCIINALLKQEKISDGDVLKLIALVNARISADSKGRGLLLIIDELGKSLEHAASAAGESDVFLMQRLAEEASRSGETPLFVIGILHQGFGAYAAALGLTAKREWDKVAGRYDEIVFHHPMEQTVSLVAEALNVPAGQLKQTDMASSRQAMKQAIQLGWYGSTASYTSLEKQAPRIFPLDPCVLPIMSRILHRFGQNQRSIFSFLFGSEPFALIAFRKDYDGQFYRIHHLYDYIHSNLGHHLASVYTSTHWTTIDSMVGSFSSTDPLHTQIVKTVGVLNLLNSSDLTPTTETVSLCLTGVKDDASVREAIDILKSDAGKRVLFDRGVSGGLCLWPHISVDLERAQKTAESMIGPIKSPADFIQTHLDNTNLVARRHYIKTGNLRYFSVVFCNPKDLENPINLPKEDADGIILTPLCLNQKAVNDAIIMAQSTAFKARSECLVAIPGQLQSLSPFIREVQIWNWIATNTPELNGDRYGRETVSRKMATAQQALDEAISQVIGLDNLGESFSLKFFWKGKPLDITSGRKLLSKLSDICDHLFKTAPIVRNELINRQNISSAAAAARMRLIERILEIPNERLLGMDPEKKPPEMSMYMSVLQHGGLHVETETMSQFVIPSESNDHLRLLPTLTHIETRLKGEPDRPIRVSLLLNELAAIPFGIRAGLAPLLLAVFYVIHRRNIACYENGTFLSELSGAEFLRLTKKPETFEFQYCNIEGLRIVAFEQLARVLNVSADREQPDLLDVVRPLCVIVARLCPYAQKTKQLSPGALAVRNALMDARDPLKLLFELLPSACGYEPIGPDDKNGHTAKKYAQSLSQAIDELRGCYSALQERMKNALIENFGYSRKTVGEFRKEIGARADALSSFVAEAQLKAFCFRLKDTLLSDNDWLDSVASMVAAKPPEKWADQDERIFNEHLSELAGRFVRTEGVAFDKKGNYESGSMRLCVTLPDGTEKKQVLTAAASDRGTISALQETIQKLIKEHGDLALVAASKAVWENLKG